MYSCVKSAAKLEQGVTPFFQSHVGVKQECNLSPTLFNLFINDIPNLFNTTCEPVKFGDTELNTAFRNLNYILRNANYKLI